MRCPNCNQWNRATLPRCMRCGTELSVSESVAPSWRSELRDDRAGKEYIRVDEDGQADVTPDRRDVLAAEMAELKARKDDGTVRLQRLMTEAPPVPQTAAETRPDGSFTMPEPSAHQTRRTARVALHGMPQQSSTARSSVMNPAQWNDSRNYDPIVDDMQQNNVFRQPANLNVNQLPDTPSRRVSKRRVIRLLTVLLVIVVLGLAGAIGFSAWSEYRASQSDKNRALVTASMKDDLAAHTILIPGEEGQKIYIRELHGTYTVVGGFATIVIPDHNWYDDLDVVTEETMSVTITPTIQSGGRQKPLDPITYDITIPLSPIELVTPEKLRTEVSTAMHSLVFKVRPGSIVTINKVDMSDAVDENGQLTYNATVQPKGDNVYTINVRSPYCRDNSMDVVLFRQVQEIPLDLAATTYSRTSENKYPITCTTLPGADVTVLSPHSDLNITKLDSTGEFTFVALFDKIGDNTVSIQATYPGKKTSRVDYTIYYLPNQDVYTRKAWSLTRSADYAELVGNITYRAANTQIYVAMGKIDSFVSESPQMAVMYCSEDGTSQPVLLQNATQTVWKKGEYYRIYADVYSSYNGMPWLIARYTYKD